MFVNNGTQRTNYKAYPAPIIQRLGILDEWRRLKLNPILKDMVTFLEIRDGDIYYPIGTAFFLYHQEGNHLFYYLCTCRHIIKPCVNEGNQIFIRVNLRDEKGVEHIPLHGGWIYYEDDEPEGGWSEGLVDLAVLQIEPVESAKPTIFSSIPAKYAYGEKGIRQEYNRPIIPGDEVVFVGLFQNYTGHDRNYPLFRFGRIALVSEEPLPGVEPWLGLHAYYLVECQAYPGMSGSPVFIPYEEKERGLFLVGVMAGYYKEDEQLEGKFTHYGISQMVPADILGDMIYGEILTKKREKALKRAKMSKGPCPASSTTFPPRQTQEIDTTEDTGEGITKDESEDA